MERCCKDPFNYCSKPELKHRVDFVSIEHNMVGRAFEHHGYMIDCPELSLICPYKATQQALAPLRHTSNP